MKKQRTNEDFWRGSLARALGRSFWECPEESSFFHPFGHHFFIILASFFHHFGLRLVHHFLGSSEIRRIRSKNHKNDEKIKKNEDFWWGSLARALGRSFWECLEESSFFHHFGHHFFIILVIIFSSFWPSFAPSFPRNLRDS